MQKGWFHCQLLILAVQLLYQPIKPHSLQPLWFGSEVFLPLTRSFTGCWFRLEVCKAWNLTFSSAACSWDRGWEEGELHGEWSGKVSLWALWTCRHLQKFLLNTIVSGVPGCYGQEWFWLQCWPWKKSVQCCRKCWASLHKHVPAAPQPQIFACHPCGEILPCLQASLGKLLGKDREEAEMEEECDPLSCDWWLCYFKVKLNF